MYTCTHSYVVTINLLNVPTQLYMCYKHFNYFTKIFSCNLSTSRWNEWSCMVCHTESHCWSCKWLFPLHLLYLMSNSNQLIVSALKYMVNCWSMFGERPYKISIHTVVWWLHIEITWCHTLIMLCKHLLTAKNPNH